MMYIQSFLLQDYFEYQKNGKNTNVHPQGRVQQLWTAHTAGCRHLSGSAGVLGAAAAGTPGHAAVTVKKSRAHKSVYVTFSSEGGRRGNMDFLTFSKTNSGKIH